MRDLATVLQDLYRREVNCRIESFWDRGFRIVLGDRLNGEDAAFAVDVDELPDAGERLWELACRRYPAFGGQREGPGEPSAVERVVPLSKVIARAVPENVFPVSDIAPTVMEVDVLSYAVRRANERFETIWYTNARGEVREEVVPRREPWRQSDRFRMAEEKSLEDFRRLYLGSGVPAS
jgi:hypothetical protein